MANILGFVSFGVSILALIFQIIGLAVPYWYYKSVTISTVTGKVHFGLWRSCVDSVCASTTDTIKKDYFKAVQAVEVLAFLALVCVVIFVILRLFVMKDKPLLATLGVVFCFVAAAFALIGVIIYAAKINDDIPEATKQLHVGFVMCILSGITAVVTGVLLYLFKSKSAVSAGAY